MNRIRWFFVLVPFSLVAGCGKVSTPEFSADELQAARRALPISEVSLMVRSGYDQNKILADVQHRHVPTAIDGKTEESLIQFGAKPALISALKSEANVLTKREKQAFDQLTAERDSRITNQQSVGAYGNEPVKEPQRKIVPAVKAVNQDSPEEAYWKAEAAYRAKRSELESQISSQQGYINRMRSRGYHESYLASAVDRLHQYEDELKNLKAPIR